MATPRVGTRSLTRCRGGYKQYPVRHEEGKPYFIECEYCKRRLYIDFKPDAKVLGMPQHSPRGISPVGFLVKYGDGGTQFFKTMSEAVRCLGTVKPRKRR